MKAAPRLIVLISVSMAVVGAARVARSPMRLVAQEDVLQSPSNQDLRTLRQQQKALNTIDPFDNQVSRALSPDSQALQILDETASSASSELRAATDLLAVYDNMQCAPDRASVKLLLEDRLRLYSRLLDLGAEKATIPLGPPSIIKLAATTKKALKLHDDLIAAKNKLDAITASLR